MCNAGPSLALRSWLISPVFCPAPLCLPYKPKEEKRKGKPWGAIQHPSGVLSHWVGVLWSSSNKQWCVHQQQFPRGAGAEVKSRNTDSWSAGAPPPLHLPQPAAWGVWRVLRRKSSSRMGAATGCRSQPLKNVIYTFVNIHGWKTETFKGLAPIFKQTIHRHALLTVVSQEEPFSAWAIEKS